MEGVGGAGLEVIFLVPDPRFIVLGMDKQGSDAGNVGGLGSAKQGILQNCLAQTLSLLRTVDS